MTGTRLPRPPWPWADPFWLARKQFEAARLMMRLTESVVEASVSSVLGATGRTVTAPALAEPTATATVTVPAPRSAPVPVPHFATEPVPVPHFATEQAPVEAKPVEAKPVEATLVPVPDEATGQALTAEPPVPGWDELSLGSIRARLRRLSEEDLVALHGYEESHAGRPDVLSMLQNRLIKVRSEN